MADVDGSYQGSDSWEVEQLRATTFSIPDPLFRVGGSLWESVVGTRPDEERFVHTDGREEIVGKIEGMSFTSVSRPGRVDWMLQRVGPTQGFPVIGPLDASVKKFRSVVYRWLDDCPPLVRLALGTTLVKPTYGLQQGYEELMQSLPDLHLDLSNASDFLYQINRFRESQVARGTRINRLSKWSVMESGTIEISLSPEGGAILPPSSRQFACRLELDINTALTGEVIPKDKNKKLFNELVGLGIEIAHKGDVP